MDNTLLIREMANTVLDTREFDFRVVDSPNELCELIIEKNKERNHARGTSRRMEVDYNGVNIEPDLIVRDGQVITRPEKRAGSGQLLKGWG